MSIIIPSSKAEQRRVVRNPKTGRKKTSIACHRCWKSKTRCSIKRPCQRCTRLGHGDDCHDRAENTRKRQHTNKTKKVNHKIKTNTTNSNNYINGDGHSSNSCSLESVTTNNTMASYHSLQFNELQLPPIITPITPINVPFNINNMYFHPLPVPALQLQLPLPSIFNKHAQQNEADSSNTKEMVKKKRKKMKKEPCDKEEVGYNCDDVGSDDEKPPVKKRKLSKGVGNMNDDIFCNWHEPHTERDELSDSSHYSTEYSEDEDDDCAVPVIISICRDTQKTPIQFHKMTLWKTPLSQHNDNNDANIDDCASKSSTSSFSLSSQSPSSTDAEVWSHYTFTDGSLTKFVSIEENENKNAQIPFNKMASSIQNKPSEKKQTTVDEDLAAILAANNINRNRLQSTQKIVPVVNKRPMIFNLTIPTSLPTQMPHAPMYSAYNLLIPPQLTTVPIPPKNTCFSSINLNVN